MIWGIAMATRRLSQDELDAACALPMKDIRSSGRSFIDIKPYLNGVPRGDFEGHELLSRDPVHVYLTPDGRYEHYVLPTRTTDVVFVIVADNQWQGFHGHRLMDLRRMYGK